MNANATTVPLAPLKMPGRLNQIGQLHFNIYLLELALLSDVQR